MARGTMSAGTTTATAAASAVFPAATCAPILTGSGAAGGAGHELAGIGAAAFGTLRRLIAENQLLKIMAAFFTAIFINRHGHLLVRWRLNSIGGRGRQKTYRAVFLFGGKVATIRSCQ